MITPINTHVQDALARLFTQYQDASNLKNVITAIVTPIQDLETVIQQMNTQRSIFTAVGVQLDLLGTIIGLSRTPGTTDDDYRNQLLAQIKINTSDGQPEQVIQAYQLFTGSDLVILNEWFPAEVELESDYLPPDQITVDYLLGIIGSVLPAGVRCDSIITFDSTEAFAMDGSLPGLGFGDDSDPSVGGKFPFEFYRNTFFEMEGDDVNGGGFGAGDLDPLVGGYFDDI